MTIPGVAVAEMFVRDDYFLRFDLLSGYYHIDVHEAHQKYLGFHWHQNGKEHFYVFTVLPFGLSPASYVFSKTLRPLTKKSRAEGIKIVVFLVGSSLILRAPVFLLSM